MKIETKFNIGNTVYAVIRPSYTEWYDHTASIEEFEITDMDIYVDGDVIEVTYRYTDPYDVECNISAEEKDCFITHEGAKLALNLSRANRDNRLAEFILYYKKHPDERFWQALHNWSGKYIFAGESKHNLEDTYED